MRALPLLQELILSVITEQPDFKKTLSAKSLNVRLARSFVICCAGSGHREYVEAERFLSNTNSPLAEFFRYLLDQIPDELESACQNYSGFNRNVKRAAQVQDRQEALYQFMFPEGYRLNDPGQRDDAMKSLRQKRQVVVEQTVPNPLTDPATELLFTSNVLLTRPLAGMDKLHNISDEMRRILRDAAREPQKYWYDHPIPIGVDQKQNEILYGLQGLQRMMEQDPMAAGKRLTVVLSVSTTHDHLHQLAKPYLNQLLGDPHHFDKLTVFLFTEQDTRQLKRQILQPLAEAFFPESDKILLESIIGVDGEYGRHYSFLKAVAALWQVFLNPDIKATFKIDLDQIFHQQALMEQTGKSALQHFCTDLWGARARDAEGQPVELGMIAGALVNETDFIHGLFTPDVRFPEPNAQALDERIFFSRLPQALSTEAEMMYRGSEAEKKHALQRIHVTGGTNGIRIDALFRHRPFTPTFVGRAEDQAYLLSVLDGRKPGLRYLHQPGLIMRHDKNSFAAEAISAALVGKVLGDYVRTLVFSAYARVLPLPLEEIKREVDPFSGAFISYIPKTLIALRTALHILAMEVDGKSDQIEAFCSLAVQRLSPLLKAEYTEELAKKYQREQAGWQLYYSILQKAKENPEHPVVRAAKKAARDLVESCAVGRD